MLYDDDGDDDDDASRAPCPPVHILLPPLDCTSFPLPQPPFCCVDSMPLIYNVVLLSNFPHLNLEKVLWRTVDLVKALLPRVWHGLHDGPVQIRRLAGRLRGVLIVRQFGGVIRVMAMA